MSQQVQPVYTGMQLCAYRMHIESDHEPLKAVFNKPVHKLPKRLQRMLMALQNYSLDVQYEKGELMWMSDALSCTYRNTTEFVQHDKSLVCSIEEVDHLENLSIAPIQTCRIQMSDSEWCSHAKSNCVNKERMGAVRETVWPGADTILWQAKRTPGGQRIDML